MQNKLLIIQQYFGLGDIIWGQTIANDFIKGGYKVLWPVLPPLVEGLNRAYPNVMFVDYKSVDINYENKDYKEEDGVLVLPMRYSEFLMKKPYRHHMESKYSFLGKDWRTWKEGGKYERNRAKEIELMKIIGVDDGEPYNIISTVFGGNVEFKIDVVLNNGYKNVELRQIPGFSLFDWSAAMEGASEIHAVSSATLYIFELLDLKMPIHLYVRKPIEPDFLFVEFLFTKPYILHK